MRAGRHAGRRVGQPVDQFQYVLGYSGVLVFTPDGKLLGRIRLPEVCANVTFGGPKRNMLFMCASQSLYLLQVQTQGAAPG